MQIDERTESLLGKEALEILARSHVVVFGLGGVGGHAAEALCRGGVGALTLVDADVFQPSNCNRQRFADESTVGRAKVEVAKEALQRIRPECRITTVQKFILPGEDFSELLDGADYVLDAIDTLAGKLAIVEAAQSFGIPVISSMGTGNKLDPTAFRVSRLSKTRVCPLAREMRRACRSLGLDDFKVVFSEEEPRKAIVESENGRHAPGSLSFVPGVAGMILAGEVIKDLIKPCLS